jgi:hypothetical protein
LCLFVGLFNGDSEDFRVRGGERDFQRSGEARQAFLRLIQAHRFLQKRERCFWVNLQIRFDFRKVFRLSYTKYRRNHYRISHPSHRQVTKQQQRSAPGA